MTAGNPNYAQVEAAAAALVDTSLRSADPAERARALDGICDAILHDPGSRYALLKCIDGVARRTKDAAYLERLSAALLKLLAEGEDAAARYHAAFALAQFGRAAVDPISQALLRAALHSLQDLARGAPNDERLPLLDALGTTHDSGAVPAILETVQMQERLPDNLPHAVLERVDEKCDEYLQAAVRALVETGEAAIPFLQEAVRTGSSDQALVARKALAAIGGESAEDALAGQLQSQSASQRLEAAIELAQNQDPRALPVLLAALNDANLSIRMDAVEGLGQLDCPEAEQALMSVFRSGDQVLRDVAAEALAEIHSRKDS